ncbi:metal-dependent hydrolase [Candidatus Woesearchaeota archaeon]|jgi:membrane-bound metal-dependent hydrolase YbcI (DUF457 family)|nr:metal-dependent hydrolase [Candidatus Woesearchaeota archaeon]MBT4111209.1 metal-dependent hydrolase [Candidatus Woesearchaeota archaeon]MBT4336789.1 metal-dependent hydrolase [Candidatus Woesearchaeota archaeon]MBT4469457.1 metal-dependent hydrolase [Candidatus Woesearchaeota archaeon]MBT6744148.1 metal-dependent hydrolase [Candidatus Woesearchaeota archaeon]
MAYAVTHIILTIVVLDLFRHYVFGKRRFPRYMLVIGGIAGLLPDIDIPLSWIYNLFTGLSVNFHGMFTHSLIFPIIFALIGVIFHFKKGNHKWAKIFYIIAFGLFFHSILDCAFGGYKTFFWPFYFINFCPQWGIASYMQSVDAIILVVWLLHEEIHNKIKDYI